MEDRHHITHGNIWMDSAARCLKAENESAHFILNTSSNLKCNEQQKLLLPAPTLPGLPLVMTVLLCKR